MYVQLTTEETQCNIGYSYRALRVHFLLDLRKFHDGDMRGLESSCPPFVSRWGRRLSLAANGFHRSWSLVVVLLVILSALSAQ